MAMSSLWTLVHDNDVDILHFAISYWDKSKSRNPTYQHLIWTGMRMVAWLQTWGASSLHLTPLSKLTDAFRFLSILIVLYLFFCPPTCLSVCLSVGFYQSQQMPSGFRWSILFCVRMSFYLSVCLYLYSVHNVCLLVFVCLCLFYLSNCHLIVCLSVLHLCLSVCLYFCLSVCLFVCLSIFPQIKSVTRCLQAATRWVEWRLS